MEYIRIIDKLPKYVRKKILDILPAGYQHRDNHEIYGIIPVIVKVNDKKSEEPTFYYKGVAVSNRGLLQVSFKNLPLFIKDIGLEMSHSYKDATLCSTSEVTLTIAVKDTTGVAIYEIKAELDDDVKEKLGIKEL